jgi:hypothetical protein
MKKCFWNVSMDFVPPGPSSNEHTQPSREMKIKNHELNFLTVPIMLSRPGISATFVIQERRRAWALPGGANVVMGKGLSEGEATNGLFSFGGKFEYGGGRDGALESG